MSVAVTQAWPGGVVEDQIERIRANVAARTARIPDYTCQETIDRTWCVSHDKTSRVADRVRFEVQAAEGREHFAWPGGGRFDDGEVRAVLGRGLTKSGDFSGFLTKIFTPNAATFTAVGEESAGGRRTIRYDYSVPRSSGYVLIGPGGRALAGFHGSFWVDAETLDLARLEIEAGDIPPALRIASSKLAIDYGLVTVGPGSFLIPQTVEARMVSDRGFENRSLTHYSQCHQFVVESTVSFEERPAERAVREAVGEEAILPSGVNLDTELVAPIDRKTAAVGDIVQARIRKDAAAGGGVRVPKDALLEGRILLIERHESAPPCEATQPSLPCDLLLRFTSVRCGAIKAGLRGYVVKYAPLASPPVYMSQDPANASPSVAARHIEPRSPMEFWSGFRELPKGFRVTIQTEAIPPR